MRLTAVVGCAGIVAAFSCVLAASQAAKIERGQAVFVVAVKTLPDNRLFRYPCRAGLWVNGRQVTIPGPPPKPRTFPAPELVSSLFDPIPGGVPDASLKARVEREFARRKKFRIAATAAEADFVLVVDRTWGSMSSFEAPAPPRPPDPARPFDPLTPPPPPPPNASHISHESDRPLNLLVSLGAIAVPAALFHEHATDLELLVEGRAWEWFVQQPGESEVEKVVGRFHDNRRLPKDTPFCALPQPVRAEPLVAENASRAGEIEAPRPAAAASTDSRRRPLFQSQVLMVTVPIVATGPDNRPVTDLRKQDFRVYEDGAEQVVDRVVEGAEPFTVALVVDTSNSMRARLEDMKAAASAFVDTLAPGDRLMIASFDSRVWLVSDITDDRDRLGRAILTLRIGTETRLDDALATVMSERLEKIDGRKAIVLLTDGKDVGSALATSPGIVAMVEASNVPVYVVQFDTRQTDRRLVPAGAIHLTVPREYMERAVAYAVGTAYLQDLARAAGGIYAQAQSIDQVDAAFAAIAEEMRRAYTLAYYPEDQARDGSVRRIRVEVSRPGVTVRARAAYRAARQ